jgi:hypothetical protein
MTYETWRGHIYEEDAQFDEKSYREVGEGVAWFIIGWEVEATEDIEWSGYYKRTGNVLACMVGDDRARSIDPDDLIYLSDADYCPGCGQIGCMHVG